jgi:hypothetical protein
MIKNNQKIEHITRRMAQKMASNLDQNWKSYDFLNRGVTICVTPFMSNLLIFVSMLYEHDLLWIFS